MLTNKWKGPKEWQLTDNNDDNANNPDLFELELKIKQQILFTLIKKVTK